MCESCCFSFLWPSSEPEITRPSSSEEEESPRRRPRPQCPRSSLRALKEGNERFVLGLTTPDADLREQMRSEMDSKPHCAIITCADSLAPLESIFDCDAGDIFALRNAGNTCTHAEGSMVGSLEFCTGQLDTKVILVLGHSNCQALHAATTAYFDNGMAVTETALSGLLQDLSHMAAQAVREIGKQSVKEVTNHAVKLNVFRTVNYILKFSGCIRRRVRSREVEVQGAILDLATGRVTFLGCSPSQDEYLTSKISLPLSVARDDSPARGSWGVRTAADGRLTARESLDLLREGNERFMLGTPLAKPMDKAMREALVNHGQAPVGAILGCADSRVPVDTIFDCMPGDLFVLRNAGNTFTHAAGSMLGSLEFCASKLGLKLILVLGHTQCTALTGAAEAYLNHESDVQSSGVATALDGLLTSLSTVSKRTAKMMRVVDAKELAAHSTRVNVVHSIDFMLKYSLTIRELVKNCGLEIHGGIYRLETGKVDFLGPSPNQAHLLSSEFCVPPSMLRKSIRSSLDGPMHPNLSLQLLKEGNERYVNGDATAMSSARLGSVEEAPHCAIVGCSDSRAPLETIFDAGPGDIFALRNAGNTCTHAEGSMLGSLEYCTSLGARLILVLGHTECQALRGATKMFLESQGLQPTVNKALDALLAGLSTVAKQAADELGPYATEESIIARATKLNIYRSINFLLQHSSFIREKVERGEVEIQGALYDLETGQVHFMGRSPLQHATERLAGS